MTTNDTGLTIAGKTYRSRLLVGSGKYKSLEETRLATEASGAEIRIVSWQGSGTYDNPQFVPKVFTLSAGTHQLVVRGREAGVLMDSISITAPPQNPPQPPANLRVTSN